METECLYEKKVYMALHRSLILQLLAILILVNAVPYSILQIRVLSVVIRLKYFICVNRVIIVKIQEST